MCDEVLIEYSNFINLTRKAEHDFGGVCIYVYKGFNTIISECAFLHQTNPQKPSVHIQMSNDHSSIISCCFSSPENIESSTGMKYRSCSFDNECELYSPEATPFAEISNSFKYEKHAITSAIFLLGLAILHLMLKAYSFINHKKKNYTKLK
jgi:hypothetical protein